MLIKTFVEKMIGLVDFEKEQKRKLDIYKRREGKQNTTVYANLIEQIAHLSKFFF